MCLEHISNKQRAIRAEQLLLIARQFGKGDGTILQMTQRAYIHPEDESIKCLVNELQLSGQPAETVATRLLDWFDSSMGIDLVNF